MTKSRRTYTAEFKREAVELVTRQGLSVAEAARRLGVHVNLLRNWKRNFESNGSVASATQPSAIEAECARLRAENERLRMERDILPLDMSIQRFTLWAPWRLNFVCGEHAVQCSALARTRSRRET